MAGKALILGINGGFGGHVAEALRQRGYELRALVRDEARLEPRFATVERVVGEVADAAALRRAAEGCELMVYGVSPAGYDWEGKALPWLEQAARVAEERRMTLLFPGNVYVYDPADGPHYSEQSPHRPITRKGEIREAMEQRLREASQGGAQVLLIRAGDFIGAGTRASWLPLLIKHTRKGYRFSRPGAAGHRHSWAYLPDLAAGVAELAQRRGELAAFEEFHFRGYQLSLAELAQALQRASGEAVRASPLPWFAFRLLAPFSVLFRGLLEMRYLWQQEIHLDGDRLRATLGGSLPATPLEQALRRSLQLP